MYLTQADMVARLTLPEMLRLTRTNPLNVTKVSTAIGDAEAVINTWAAGTFGYPWSVVPVQATEATFVIAQVYLHQRSWRGTPLDADLQIEYSRIMQELKNLRDKKTSWVATNSPEVANLSQAFVSMPNDTPKYDSPRQSRFGKLRKIL